MTIDDLGRELAMRLALTRTLVCLDLESTGVRAEHDRIVQIAAASVFPTGRVTRWSSFVNPELPIPRAATAIHGISDVIVSRAPVLAQLAPTIASLLSGSDLAGFNVERFDRRMLAAEFRRVGLEDPTRGARVIDAYTIFVRQEPRSLRAALRFYGVEHADGTRPAHEANSDVEATLAVLLAQCKTYDDLPTSVADVHDRFAPCGLNRIDVDGTPMWRDGVATVAVGAHVAKEPSVLVPARRPMIEPCYTACDIQSGSRSASPATCEDAQGAIALFPARMWSEMVSDNEPSD
jgi:DNA polymerase III subunit epsilon